SGKMLPRILRKIAAAEFSNHGAPSTLADPPVVDDLLTNRQNRKSAQLIVACHKMNPAVPPIVAQPGTRWCAENTPRRKNYENRNPVTGEVLRTISVSVRIFAPKGPRASGAIGGGDGGIQGIENAENISAFGCFGDDRCRCLFCSGARSSPWRSGEREGQLYGWNHPHSNRRTQALLFYRLR